MSVRTKRTTKRSTKNSKHTTTSKSTAASASASKHPAARNGKRPNGSVTRKSSQVVSSRSRPSRSTSKPVRTDVPATGNQKTHRRKPSGPARGTQYVTNNGNTSLIEASRTIGSPVSDTVKQSARNLLDSIGGVDKVLTILAESDHPNAPKLADILRSENVEIMNLPFGRKILDAGLTPSALAEILYDRQKTRTFVQATMEMPEVIAGISRRAKDQFERCGKCLGYGRRLTKQQLDDQEPPDDDAKPCLPCDGIGWKLVGGDTEAIDRFLELVRLRKSGSQTVYDFSKKQLNQNQFNNPTMNFGGAGDGESPSIDSIIKRADSSEHRLLLPAPASEPKTATEQPSVIDAELMPEEHKVVGE